MQPTPSPVPDHPSAAGQAPSAPQSLPEASLGQLIPWPDDDNFPKIPAEDALELFLSWVESRGIQPWDHQEEALLDLAAGDNVILGTPTGSGKSLVALGMCFMATCTDRRSYYTAPIKALVSEKFFNMVDVLGRDNVGMVTGDVTINPQAPVVCCTAEILANLALAEGEGADVGCVAMDEFHFFDDRDRGWAWLVPLLALPKTQFLLMSATLGDVSAIASSLEAHTGRPVDQILDAPRPVPLTWQFVDTGLEATVKVALEAGKAPIYVVHFSQDAAFASANSLASFGVSTREQRDAIREAIAGTRFTTAFGKALRRLLLQGVGVHHAGMLPRYRLLVERLAQEGLLPVICGTDTLGVGINVPIHTVLLTALSKFDGRRMRRLNAREFHQIAGRAGRAGFDTEGLVVAQATEYDIENARNLAKAGGDAKRARKMAKKHPPEGFVGWNEQTFQHLVEATPETLRPHLRVTHSMVLSEVEQGGDARARLVSLIADSGLAEADQARLVVRLDEVIATLVDAGVVVREEDRDAPAHADGTPAERYSLTVDLPEDFALDQPLSPFLLAALELLDPESDTYALDVISMVEATLEDPRQILRVQERRARDAAMAQMKADGIDYDERIERIQEVTYPKPLEDLLDAAYERYCAEVPWAADFALSPKSVLRDMVETASDFKGYVAAYGIARSEGTLLRYLSDAYRVLDRTVPRDKYDERLEEIVSWLGLVVRTVDSSLVDEWAGLGQEDSQGLEAAAPTGEDLVVRDRRALQLLVRNALWQRVRLVASRDAAGLGELDGEWGWGERRWAQELEALYATHDEVLLGADAHSGRYFILDEADEHSQHVWRVRQGLHDADGGDDFALVGEVDLDATQEEGSVVFKTYDAGFPEDLA